MSPARCSPPFRPSEPRAPPEAPRSPGALDREFWGHWLLHRAHLRTLSLRLMGGHTSEADDALSIAALHARGCYPAYAHRLSNPRGWLTTLLRNVCMDCHRESKAREQRMDPDLLQRTSRDPERQLDAREQLESVRAVLGELPAHLRQP